MTTLDCAAPLARLRVGDHACVPVHGPDQRLTDLAGYTVGGLRRGEQVLLFAADPAGTGTELAGRVPGCRAALGRGQVAVLDSVEVYLSDGGLDAEVMLRQLVAVVDSAVAAGYSGLRVAGDLTFAVTAGVGVDTVIDYETRVNALFTELPLIALCHYDPKAIGRVAWQRLSRTHPTTLSAGAGAGAGAGAEPVARLRARRTSTGLCLSGEADLANHAALVGLLAGLPTIPGGCTVDATGLAFADVAAIAALLRAVAGRRGRPTTIVAPAAVVRVLDLLGSAGLPGLTVVTSGPRCPGTGM